MKNKTTSTRLSAPTALAAGACLLILWAAGCATTNTKTTTGERNPVPLAECAALKNIWGIEVTGLHLSANGRMVDFRYRVLDPVKAVQLGDRSAKPALTDLSTGEILHVPSFPKIGSMRQMTSRPQAGKIYFMMFSNANGRVKSGSKVNIEIGKFKAQELTIE